MARRAIVACTLVPWSLDYHIECAILWKKYTSFTPIYWSTTPHIILFFSQIPLQAYWIIFDIKTRYWWGNLKKSNCLTMSTSGDEDTQNLLPSSSSPGESTSDITGEGVSPRTSTMPKRNSSSSSSNGIKLKKCCIMILEIIYWLVTLILVQFWKQCTTVALSCMLAYWLWGGTATFLLMLAAIFGKFVTVCLIYELTGRVMPGSMSIHTHHGNFHCPAVLIQSRRYGGGGVMPLAWNCIDFPINMNVQMFVDNTGH